MKILYDIITILPLSLLTVVLFGGAAGVPESASGYALCLGCSAWLVLLRNMKFRNRLRSIGIVTVFLAGFRLAAGEVFRQQLMESYFWVFWIIGFSAAAFLVGILSDRSLWMRRAVSAAAFGYCIAGSILDWEIRKSAFALICLLLLIRTAEELQRRWNKSGYPDSKEHITRLAPIFLTFCLLVYAVPAPDAPYDWKLVKTIWSGTVSAVSRIYGSLTHPAEGYGSTGFSDYGGFLSELGSNDEEVLSIQVNHTTIRDFRLVGCISGDFQGREWVFDTCGEGTSRMMDTIETACAVRKFDTSSRAEYLQKLDMQYENLFYNTHYIFSPAKIKLEATKEKNAGFSEQNGSIVSRKKLHYQDQYTVSCYVLNFGNPQLGALLDNAAPIDETEWQLTAIAEKVQEQDGYCFADYQAYRRRVYEQYCHSYAVSAKTAAVLNEIQNSTDSRFEMLKMLETYLRNLEYSTDCGLLPDSVTDAGSFLDYFLFTSQKGYCMHFATAFVLMANAMGIPCRYVQGYHVRRDAYGKMHVTQNNAHAWPEAYFDNVGWIAFEPTPVYAVPTGWKIRSGAVPVPVPTEPVTDAEMPEIVDFPAEPGQETDAFDLRVILVPALAVLGFLLLFYGVSRAAARRKYQRMSEEHKFRYLTQQNLRFLGRLGFRMEEGETLAEFSARVRQSDRQDIREQLGFISAYEALLYSGCGVTDTEISAAEYNHHTLRKLVRKNRFRRLFPARKA